MKKSQLFSLILSIVSDVTEISSEDILSKSRKEDVVEARMLLVYFCNKEGLLPSKISELSGICHRSVNMFISKAYSLIPNGGGYANNQLKFYLTAVESKIRAFQESIEY